jgi:hypothetical protein
VGDAAIEGAVHDPAAFLKVVDVTEIVPETEGNSGKLQAGITAAAVGHAAIVARGIEHERNHEERVSRCQESTSVRLQSSHWIWCVPVHAIPADCLV